MDAYELVRTVGQGTFGRALLCRKKSSREMVIVKQTKVGMLSAKEREGAMNEVRLLRKLDHPNIVRVYDSFFDKQGHLCIVMEYAEGGDLQAQVKKSRGSKISEPKILKWVFQMLSALHHIHDSKVLHRDIKSQNVFLSGTGDIKLGDFGIGKSLDYTQQMAKTMVGTPYYMSPELCNGRPYSYAADVWALGCVVYELCVHKPPFDARDIHGLIVRITNSPAPSISAQYSKALQSLTSQMLEKDPKKRPACKAMLKLPLFDSLSQNSRDVQQSKRPNSAEPKHEQHRAAQAAFQQQRPLSAQQRGHGAGYRPTEVSPGFNIILTSKKLQHRQKQPHGAHIYAHDHFSKQPISKKPNAAQQAQISQLRAKRSALEQRRRQLAEQRDRMHKNAIPAPSVFPRPSSAAARPSSALQGGRNVRAAQHIDPHAIAKREEQRRNFLEQQRQQAAVKGLPSYGLSSSSSSDEPSEVQVVQAAAPIRPPARPNAGIPEERVREEDLPVVVGIQERTLSPGQAESNDNVDIDLAIQQCTDELAATACQLEDLAGEFGGDAVYSPAPDSIGQQSGVDGCDSDSGIESPHNHKVWDGDGSVGPALCVPETEDIRAVADEQPAIPERAIGSEWNQTKDQVQAVFDQGILLPGHQQMILYAQYLQRQLGQEMLAMLLAFLQLDGKLSEQGDNDISRNEMEARLVQFVKEDRECAEVLWTMAEAVVWGMQQLPSVD